MVCLRPLLLAHLYPFDIPSESVATPERIPFGFILYVYGDLAYSTQKPFPLEKTHTDTRKQIPSLTVFLEENNELGRKLEQTTLS